MGLALQNEHKVQQVICIYFITNTEAFLIAPYSEAFY